MVAFIHDIAPNDSIFMLFVRPWYLAGLLGPWLPLIAAPLALAQITPDATLGTEGSLFSSGVVVRGDVADLIEGGAIRGSNLFHSFLEFNINAGQRVYFASPAGIESILSRITGGDPSDIFGTLGVDGAANLFLLNPNGIVFGETAALDIEGSFYASTAEAIPLGDGVYSATAPEQSNLLTINSSALFSSYLTNASGDIENRGQLVAGEDLTLVANQLDLQGQVAAGNDLTLLGNTVQIRDTAAVPFVGFAGGDLLVQGNEQVDIVALSHADSGLYSYGDMVLRSANSVGGDAHYWSGGNFRVENLGSDLGNLFSPIDPIIRTFGDVEIGAYQGSSLHILAGGAVNIGTALITAPDPGVIGIDFLQETITLADVATVVAIDGGAQPTLDIRAGVAPAAIGTIPPGNISGLNALSDFIVGSISAEQPLRADITVGDVLIAGSNGLVLLTNQYQPNTNLLGGNIFVTGEGLFGQGINVGGFPEFGGQGGTVYLDARNDVALTNSFISTTGAGVVGDVVINASGTVRLDRGDRITAVSTNLAEGTEGIGGSIRIAATNVEVVNGALLQASTFGIGNAGNVLISAQERVAFSGTSSDGLFASAASSDVGVRAIGAGGNIEIFAGTIEVTDGGTLLAGTLGTGDAGNVVIDARERVVFDGTSADGRSGSNAFSRVESGAVGAGGNVVIRTGSLTVTNGAQLQASTLGTGDAGNVVINARERVVFDGTGADAQFPSAAFTSVIAGAEGAGGNVNISTDTLEITNGAQLIASTEGIGDAGNVIVNARDRVIFDNGSLAVSRVEAEGQGSGGSVVINTGNLAVTNGAQLIASTEGTGDAGNVIVNARDRVIFDGARADGVGFSSSASSGVAPRAEGAAGDVVINANSVYVTNTAGFSSETSGVGNAGDVIINVLDQAVFANFSAAFSRVNTGAVGTGGNIIISADSLNVIDGSQLLANTLGNGNAGSIIINGNCSTGVWISEIGHLRVG